MKKDKINVSCVYTDGRRLFGQSCTVTYNKEEWWRG